MAKAIFQSVELYFSFFMSYLFVIRKHTFIALIVDLIMRMYLIFLAFIIIFFILTLVVKSNNDRKKFEVFNEIETTNKLIQKKP
ncbi:hypothetical protein C3420_16280 [Acinetobacter sp. ACNIH3]|uniref:Uncharacterized protein n=1 Tax=Acinetobacter pseudolwoffii TaxID=2053287 RepID=A0A2H9UII8_9GAMM|nr:hypothetical protein CU320_13750 [Acinetobacter pseudolwoffii]POU14725.1 hypothetical protein C3420_16280 [Acinetobacter sp. ACNIH3]POV71514.1 hypothetical protein C3422_19860 [Acinetobacter sp. ABNIH27]